MSVIAKFDDLKEQWSEKVGDKVNTHELAAYIYSLLEANVRIWLSYSDDNTSVNYPIMGVGPGCLMCKTGNNLTIKCKYPPRANSIQAVRDGSYVDIFDHTVSITRPRNNKGTFATTLETYKPREIDDSLDL